MTPSFFLLCLQLIPTSGVLCRKKHVEMSPRNYPDQAREQAFLRLIEANRRLIYKVCYLYATDDEHLKDLYQEVLIHLWQGLPDYRGEAKPSSWIYRVSLNACISYYRKHRRMTGETAPLESLLQTMAAEEGRTEHLREMYRLISCLNRMEKALILLWLDEHSYDEIAEITGLTRSNVATKLRRIKEKLNELANE